MCLRVGNDGSKPGGATVDHRCSPSRSEQSCFWALRVTHCEPQRSPGAETAGREDCMAGCSTTDWGGLRTGGWREWTMTLGRTDAEVSELL